MSRPKPWRNMPPRTITIAGVAIPREQVQWLAENADNPTSTRLHHALVNETRLLGISIEEREQILRALTDCPEPLAELCAVLLQEHFERVRDGLVSPPEDA